MIFQPFYMVQVGLEEAHSVDEKIEAQELQTYSDVLYTFLKHWYEHPEK